MAPNEELQSLFSQFAQARQRLDEALRLEPESEIKQDAVIQRFEFTYEPLWKVFRKIARAEKIDCISPRDCFRFALRAGLIGDEGLFLEIIDARNKTAHVYSKEEARKIYGFIKEKASAAFADSEKQLKNSGRINSR